MNHIAPPLASSVKKPIANLAREWLKGVAYFPQRPLPTGYQLVEWEPGSSYYVTGSTALGTEADNLTLTLVEDFSSRGGHVVWVGVTDDMRALCQKLLFKIAGLELPESAVQIELDVVAQCKLKYAHEQISRMWIDVCNLDDCGDIDTEQGFLASVSSFKPTLIVVDKSVSDESSHDPFHVLVRQANALRMVAELRKVNPMSSVLWQVCEGEGKDALTHPWPYDSFLAMNFGGEVLTRVEEVR